MPRVKNQPGVDLPDKEFQDTAPLATLKESPPKRINGPDLGQILLPVLLRWWFLLVVPFICGGFGYYLVSHDTTYYQGRMLMGVGPAVKEIKVSIPELLILRLTASYIQLVSSDRFLQMVAQQAPSKLDLDSLHQSIVASAIKDTPYFEFQIVGTDPAEVLKLLGSIRDLLMDESPQYQELRTQSQQEFLNNRKQELLTLIEKRTQELNSLGNNPDQGQVSLTGPGNDSPAAGPIQEELDNYNQELSEISQYSSTNVINQLHVVENPHLLSDKLGAQPRDGAIALATISFALVIILVMILEKIDPRLRYTYQLKAILPESVLLAVKKRRGKGIALELAAADLLVRATEHGSKDPAKYRLLFMVETQALKAEENLNTLAAALVGLGINCTIRNGITGESRFFPLPAYGLRPSTGETGLAINNFRGGEAGESWELVELKWPVALPIAGNLARQADDVVVVCSLNKSYRQSLFKLRDFITKAPCRVAGVIII